MYLRSIIFCIILYLCSACQEPSFYQKLAGADSMTVYFYPNQHQKDTLILPLKNFQFIKEFMQSVSDKPSDNDCQKFGKIIFHKVRAGENITEAEFSLNPQCKEIVYEYHNQEYSRKLSDANFAFLSSLKVNQKLIKKLEGLEE